MKRGDEALNAKSLQFLCSVKRFIATNFSSALNASLQLLWKKNRRLMLHCRYFFKEIYRLMLHRRYFLK